MLTDIEKVAVYEQLLHDINMFASITLDRQRLENLISMVCDWSYAHRVGNGQMSCEEQKKIVQRAFERLQHREYCEISKDCVYGDKP